MVVRDYVIICINRRRVMQYQDVSGSTPMEQSQFACENVVASLALYQQIKDTASLSDDKTSVKAAQDLMLVVYCQLMPAVDA